MDKSNMDTFCSECDPSNSTEQILFTSESHMNYFKIHLDSLPMHYIGLDTSRITAIYFSVVALDILGGLNDSIRAVTIDYIYLNQLNNVNPNLVTKGSFGFIGSPFMGHNVYKPSVKASSGEPTTTVKEGERLEEEVRRFHQGHLAMIYTALASLLTLGDDLSRVDRKSIINGMRHLQEPSGAFRATFEGGECDMRFLYCACAVSALLGDWGAVDKPAARRFILSCLTYEGGFSLIPGAEAQGGATFCAVAALDLLGSLSEITSYQRTDIERWCMHRIGSGFQGRTNKTPDTCYSFWVGATLHLLSTSNTSSSTSNTPSSTSFSTTDLVDLRPSIEFVKACEQETRGGFGKYVGSYPDVLHSFYSLAFLSLTRLYPPGGTGLEQGRLGLQGLDVALGLCENKSPRFQCQKSDS